MNRIPPAFTRVELIASVAAVALLGLAALPLLATPRADSERAGCFNNLRQLGIAMLKYADEHDDTFPPRIFPAWPERLRPYYKSTAVLVCPSDGPYPASFGSATNPADAAPRSYLFNGWSDYYQQVPPVGGAMPTSAIREPARTILFGEKVTESGHFWMDYSTFDDFMEVEHGRHLRTGNAASGGSYFTFADGSVQFLRWGASLQPVNLWAIDPALRQWMPPQNEE